MTKLCLHDFLKSLDKSIASPVFIEPEEIIVQRKLGPVYETIIAHTGSFLIDNIPYDSLIPAQNNLYFYSSTNDAISEMILFDPLIDIKCNLSNITFYYSNNSITTLILKD